MSIGKIVVIVIDLFLVSFIIKACFFDPTGDTNAIFSLVIFFLLLLFNSFALALHELFKLIKKKGD